MNIKMNFLFLILINHICVANIKTTPLYIRRIEAIKKTSIKLDILLHSLRFQKNNL